MFTNVLGHIPFSINYGISRKKSRVRKKQRWEMEEEEEKWNMMTLIQSKQLVFHNNTQRVQIRIRLSNNVPFFFLHTGNFVAIKKIDGQTD